MISAWTSHLKDEEEKKQFKERLIRLKDVFDRLSAILKQEGNNIEGIELSTKSFDTPNWANKQAFYNGYKACLQTVNKLIDLEKES